MDPLSRRRLMLFAAAAFAVSSATILTAWGFQLIGGYMPCPLCLEQRVPYYVGIPIVLVAVWLASVGRVRATRVLLIAFAAVMAYGCYLGVYQAGAEWGFWRGPTDCATADTMVRDAGSLLQTLGETHIVSCTDPALRIFGLSFAGWNAVASAFLVLIGLVGALGGRSRTR
ncbi:disulfide bond formation protein DsbB [Amorphus suaedae]